MKLRQIRAAMTMSVALAATVALSGCLGPTYGTGKTSGEQLVSDLDGMLSLGGGGPQTEAISYAPRAELVRPTDVTVLPPPREGVTAANDPNWPESPEVRRARIQAAADARDSGTVMPADVAMSSKEGMTDEAASLNGTLYDRSLKRDPMDRVMTSEELNSSRESFQAKLRESKQGLPTERKYLSEPPIAYRQPAASAPVGDPGVDEKVKEAKLKDNKGLGEKLKGLLPF